ncbi:MAG TPA: PRC-barrel domain-containing protein [Acidimicrobiia bacterium]|nr:PRC-barrel domain-containing protein [Acidimicrobiia bacterium]
MRFREADGRKVVSAESAESIGRIEAYVIDTGTRSVSAFRLAKVKGDATFVSWEDVQFGPDAVVVPSSDRLRTARDETEARLASKDLQPIGKLVLDEAGTALGKVGDVEFDPGTGAIIEFDLGDQGTITADRLLGLGAYAVVVAEAP